jgi:TetR/AcrR family transcriptional repressor of nem operon
MTKVSNREKILTEGLRVVHQRGFGGASVRDIVEAAGVPQGSFTNHFASKQAFGLEIVERYFANSRAAMQQTLRNESLAPLKRLRAFLDANKKHLKQDGIRNGCLFGNFTAELGDDSEALRARIVEIFAEVQHAIAQCLKAAVKARELPSNLRCEEVAGFVLSSMQGAILLSKARRSVAPFERFEQILLSSVLQSAAS